MLCVWVTRLWKKMLKLSTDLRHLVDKYVLDIVGCCRPPDLSTDDIKISPDLTEKFSVVTVRRKKTYCSYNIIAS